MHTKTVITLKIIFSLEVNTVLIIAKAAKVNNNQATVKKQSNINIYLYN